MYLIIDGNNWFSVAWYALKPTTSTVPAIIQADMELRAVRSIQTVMNWVEDIEQQIRPTTMAICWDSATSFRKQLMPEYKSDREKPDGYFAAMRTLRKNLDGCWQVEMDGLEADDLMAKFARDAVKANERCLLCSSDKDLHQCLIAGCVSQCTGIDRQVLNSKIFDLRVMTERALIDKYGVAPSLWVDYRCMVGDPSDGLPKPTDIGPVNAIKILSACGTLDEFYKDPFKAPISPAKRNAMLAFKEQVPLVRKLIKLPFTQEAMKYEPAV